MNLNWGGSGWEPASAPSASGENIHIDRLEEPTRSYRLAVRVPPGSRLANYITVSVTDANGVAVNGLTAVDFGVDPMIVGPGGESGGKPGRRAPTSSPSP